jgi:hypothetical protein
MASPSSLAATLGVSVDLLSSSYYNVLVHWVIFVGFPLGSHRFPFGLMLFVFSRPFEHVC